MSFLNNFINNIFSSPVTKLAGVALLDAAVNAVRPTMQQNGQDLMVQVDPINTAVQIDYVNRTMGHTTLRHVPPTPMNLNQGQMVNLQPVSALWQNIQAAQNLNNAANQQQQNNQP